MSPISFTQHWRYLQISNSPWSVQALWATFPSVRVLGWKMHPRRSPCLLWQTGDPVLRGKVPSCAPLAAGPGLASRQSYRVWPGHSETLRVHELKAGVIWMISAGWSAQVCILGKQSPHHWLALLLPNTQVICTWARCQQISLPPPLTCKLYSVNATVNDLKQDAR